MGLVEIIAIVLGLSAVAAAGVFVLHDLSQRVLAAPRPADERYVVEAADGWRIGVHRVRPTVAPDGVERLPVVLCHGLGANHFNLDYHDERSVARWLAARGWDCHVIDLRGRASSASPPPGRGRYDWCFDDYVRHDLPAVIDAVRERTGAPAVVWVGHSMGGMVMYGHLERCASLRRDPGVAAFCAFASPAAVDGMERWRGVAQLNRMLRFMPSVLAYEASRAFAPLAGWVDGPGIDILFRRGSLPGRLQRHGVANALAPISRGEVLQLAEWVLEGELRSRDGEHVYFRGLHRVRVPACIIAASEDKLAPAHNVRAAFESWGAPEKEFHLFGRETGAPVEYGHVDLVLGDTAPQVVWPVLERFVDRHGRRGPAAAETVAPIGAREPVAASA